MSTKTVDMYIINESQNGYERPSIRIINLNFRGSILARSGISTVTVEGFDLEDDSFNWN